MSIISRGTVANSRVVLLSAGCDGSNAAAYCDVLHEKLGGTKEVSNCLPFKDTNINTTHI